jgi:hypothetical protein
MRAWGAAVSAGHVLLGTLGWAVLGVAPWFFAGCAALTLFVTQLAAPLLRRRPPGGDDPGGGLPDPEPQPPWWPEFERDFRAYARADRRTPA